MAGSWREPWSPMNWRYIARTGRLNKWMAEKVYEIKDQTSFIKSCKFQVIVENREQQWPQWTRHVEERENKGKITKTKRILYIYFEISVLLQRSSFLWYFSDTFAFLQPYIHHTLFFLLAFKRDCVNEHLYKKYTSNWISPKIQKAWIRLVSAFVFINVRSSLKFVCIKWNSLTEFDIRIKKSQKKTPQKPKTNSLSSWNIFGQAGFFFCFFFYISSGTCELVALRCANIW